MMHFTKYAIGLLLLALLTSAEEAPIPPRCAIKRKCSTEPDYVCGGTETCRSTYLNSCIFATYVCNNNLHDYEIISNGTCPIITLS